jgi:hypothetical protein
LKSAKRIINLVAILATLSSAILLKAAPAVQPSFWVGVCVHFEQGGADLTPKLQLMNQLGATSFRTDLPWREVEKLRGHLQVPPDYDRIVDASIAAGVSPLFILDYTSPFYQNGEKPTTEPAIQAFSRYAEYVVRHFKGKVHMYEVFNEWDGGTAHLAPGTPEGYVNLLKRVYSTIKSVDPSITVVGGAVTSVGLRNGWLDQMLAAGAAQWLDVVSIHPYTYWDGKGKTRTPVGWQQIVRNSEASIQKYAAGRNVPIYVTEIGWPTHQGPAGTPPDEEAAFAAQTLLLSRSMPDVKGLWWYDLRDAGDKPSEPEYNFGLVKPDLTPKPAFAAFSAVAHLVSSATFVDEVHTADPDITALKFRLPDGKYTLAVWSKARTEKQVRPVEASAPEKTLTVKTAGRAAAEGITNTVSPSNPQVVFGETPVLITGTNPFIPPAAQH